MAVAAQNAPAQFRRESLKQPILGHNSPKINIFDWALFQVLEGHRIQIITSLVLD